MAVTTRGRTGPSDAPDTPPPPAVLRAAPVPGRRRPARLVAGALLAILGALAAFWIVNDAANRVPVLVMARTVAVGAPVTDADLTVAQVSVDPGVATIPAGRRSDVVGRVARTDLVAGAVLALDQVGVAGPPKAGQVLVVLAIPPSRMPATGLAAGIPILVVSTPPTDADPTAAGTPAAIAATVVRVGTPDLNGVTPVDVSVPTGDGPALAARAATGRIAIIVRPSGTR